jgi:hypothetical protein
MRTQLKIVTLIASASLLGSVAHAQINIEAARVAGGFSKPVLALSPPGDYRRLFVVEEDAARIRILDIQTGSVKATPFLSLAGKVQAGGERGLLGLAFHPNYQQNGKFYVNYTDTGSDTIVECYQVSSTNPDVADPNPVSTIIGPIFQPQTNHNGGMIAFGPDGMLYIGMGDGGNFNDQGTGHVAGGNAQSGSTLLGKLLRLDVDIPFPHIPASNPFVAEPTIMDEIWAFGMRNPWRFSFDDASGAIYIGDVGQDAREEIDYHPPGVSGLNFGWRCMEGLLCTNLSGCVCNAPELTLPIDTYPTAGDCAVVGGYVYNGCAIPNLVGTYFYADYCSSRIWSFTYDGVTKTATVNRTTELEPAGATTIQRIAGFGQDSYGEIYILDHTDGEIFKIVSADPFPDCNGNSIDDNCEITVGGVPDLNGNGIPDDCECAAITYCTAKAGLMCGTPAISSFGKSSAAAPADFFILAGPARSNRSGLLLYTNQGRDAQPFQGGTLCLKTPPLRRGPAVNSGGTATCDGEFALDMNAFAFGNAGGNPDPFLSIPGTQVNVQWWGRDSIATGSFLSDAGEYLVCP